MLAIHVGNNLNVHGTINNRREVAVQSVQNVTNENQVCPTTPNITSPDIVEMMDQMILTLKADMTQIFQTKRFNSNSYKKETAEKTS